MATAFTAYQLVAQDAPTLRTTPTRLSEVVNVKDWGAVGDGVTDDSMAIMAAVQYAYTINQFYSSSVFVPAGTYICNKQPIMLGSIVSSFTGMLKFVGAGREATVITGTVNAAGTIGVFTGSVSATTLTVTAVSSGIVGILASIGGSGFPGYPGIQVIGQLTGTPGGVGTYRTAPSSAGIASTTITSFTLPFMVQKYAGNAQTCSTVADMKIINNSTAATTGALFMDDPNGPPLVADNVHAVGNIGIMFGDTFGSAITNCYCENIVPLARADSATPNIATGSVGIVGAQTVMLNNTCVGFEHGFDLSFPSATVHGCVASRCTIGYYCGKSSPYGIGGTSLIQSGHIAGNIADRCGVGLHWHNGSASVVAGNKISGTDGIQTAAPISGMSWNVGTHVVTVTTAAAHNIGSDQSILITTANHAWTPDGTGNQIVPISNRTGTTFDYAGPSSSPGSFTNPSTWNYPLQYGLRCESINYVMFAGNDLKALVAQKSFDNAALTGGGAISNNNTLYSMRGPYGWGLPAVGSGNMTASAFRFEMCGMAGSYPAPFLQYRDLPGQSIAGQFSTQNLFEGSEFTIVNAGTVGFGAIVTGSGSNHYKIRYNGVDWIRTG